jgi:hypothetical protein
MASEDAIRKALEKRKGYLEANIKWVCSSAASAAKAGFLRSFEIPSPCSRTAVLHAINPTISTSYTRVHEQHADAQVGAAPAGGGPGPRAQGARGGGEQGAGGQAPRPGAAAAGGWWWMMN